MYNGTGNRTENKKAEVNTMWTHDTINYNGSVYRYTKDENGHLVIVEDEARIVKKIFELYLNGLGGSQD